jgi:type IX secretion system PorP/SprF family membrane protein
MKRFFSIFVVFVLLSCQSHAQQLLLDNQYLINKYSLSPAYSGYNKNFESFLGYRQQWFGIEGAPTKQMVSLNGPIGKKSGLGLTINNLSTGNFTHFVSVFNYAYHVKLGKTQSVSFGLGAEVYRNQLEGSKVKTVSDDPVVVGNEALTGTTFNANFGILYNMKNFNLGIVLPRILPQKITYKSGNQFTVASQYLIHVSYLLPASKYLEIEPFVIARGTQQSGVFYEASLMTKFKKKFWLVGTYKKSGMAMSVGAALNSRIVFNYTYEFGGNDIIALSSGTHEITLGFLIKRADKRDVPPSIFPLMDDNPIQVNTKEIDEKIAKLQDKQKNDSIGLTKKIKDLEAKIAGLENGSVAANNEVKKNPEEKKEQQPEDPGWGQPIVLRNIKFASNSPQLISSSFSELNKLHLLMKKSESSKILIAGHTDDVGSPRYNLKLSEERAIAVKKYLVENRGVDPKRIETKGFGSSKPIADNGTDEGKQQNRRIEVQFKKGN